jgi:hypothetical protein
MSGTIVISKKKSFELRTIDFNRITDFLRSFSSQSETAKKVLSTVDEYGMNMLRADELSAQELLEFATLMKQIGAVLEEQEVGLKAFLDELCKQITTQAEKMD